MLKRGPKSKEVVITQSRRSWLSPVLAATVLMTFVGLSGSQAIAATKKTSKNVVAKSVKPVRYFRGKVITGKNPALKNKKATVTTARPLVAGTPSSSTKRRLPGPRISAQPTRVAKTQVYDSNDEYSILSKDTPLTLEDELVRGSDYSGKKSKLSDSSSAGISGSSSISEMQLLAEEKPKAAPPKKWGVLMDSWNEFNLEKNEYGEADIEASNMIRLSYAVTPDVQVQATTEFGNSWGRTQTGQENFRFFDPWFGVQAKNIGKLPAGLSLAGHFRVYLPMSEESQSQDQIVQLRAQGSISKSIGPISFGYTGSPRFFAHEFASHVPEGGTSPVGHLYFRYMHTVDFSWTISKLFGFYTKNGLDHRYFYGDPQVNLPEMYQERFVSETGISFSGLDPLTLTVGVNEGSRDFLRQSNDFSLYRPEDTQAFFEATLVF